MPELRPYRWVIYFRDWPEEVATKLQRCIREGEKLVKPYRDSLTGQIHQSCFWKFWDLRPKFMEEFDEHDYVIGLCTRTKYATFERVPTCNVYNHTGQDLFSL